MLRPLGILLHRQMGIRENAPGGPSCLGVPALGWRVRSPDCSGQGVREWAEQPKKTWSLARGKGHRFLLLIFASRGLNWAAFIHDLPCSALEETPVPGELTWKKNEQPGYREEEQEEPLLSAEGHPGPAQIRGAFRVDLNLHVSNWRPSECRAASSALQFWNTDIFPRISRRNT